MTDNQEVTTITTKDYIPILESIMRISLAGFGGAMAGLSISRRAALSRTIPSSIVSSNATSTTKKKHLIHRHHPMAARSNEGTALNSHAIDRELPAAWSMACMAFTGVIEFTRFASPSRLVIDMVTQLKLADGDVKDENISVEKKENKHTEDDEGGQEETPTVPSGHIWFQPINNQTITTITDYTIGGALGGALFNGSPIRTTAGRKIDASLLSAAIRGGPMAGLLPGAGLGLLAGVAIMSIEFATKMLQDNFGEMEEEKLEDEVISSKEGKPRPDNEEAVPAHIKAMSNEELAKAIEDLKR